MTTPRSRHLLLACLMSLAPLAPLAALAGCGADVPDAPRAQVTEVEPIPATAPATGAPTGAVETLALDPAQSHVAFVAAKITRSHEGGFRDVSGTITLDAANLAQSSLRVRVATASLFIDDPRLEEHLKAPDFLDVARFPEATFRSVSIVPITGAAGAAAGPGAATHTVSGDLTLHGQTKRVSFPATVVIANDSASARAEFTIDRRDFGVVYPGMPDDLIRDSVVLRIDVRAQRPAR